MDYSEDLDNSVQNDLITHSTKVIQELYDKYSNNMFMMTKINHYISSQLPTILNNLSQTHLKN